MEEKINAAAKEIVQSLKCSDCLEGIGSDECKYCRYGEGGRAFKEVFGEIEKIVKEK